MYRVPQSWQSAKSCVIAVEYKGFSCLLLNQLRNEQNKAKKDAW
jgi:hypothetical protein